MKKSFKLVDLKGNETPDITQLMDAGWFKKGFSSFSCVKSVTNHNHQGIISNEHKAGR